MDELTTISHNEVKMLDTAALHARLAEAVTVTARGLYETAVIYTELRERGESLDDIRMGLAPYLPRIAGGALLPEAVLALAGFKTALDRVATLTPEQQREAITAEYTVVTGGDIEKPALARRRIADMSASEIRRLISDDGRMLEPSAQIEVMRAMARSRPARRRKNSLTTHISCLTM